MAREMSELHLSGISASAGMAAGTLVQLDTGRLEFAALDAHAAGDSAHQRQRLRQAVDQARAAIAELTAALNAGLEPVAADIMEFQLALLEDADFLGPAFAAIDSGAAAEAAWCAMVDAEIAGYAAADDPAMAAKADDLADIRVRVLGALCGKPRAKPALPEGDLIYAASRMTPSEFLACDPASVKAVAISGGSPGSHVAILARARGMPMLVNCGRELLEAPSGACVLVDADQARIIVHPKESRRTQFRRRLSRRQSQREQINKRVNEAAFTADGERIAIYANVDDPSLLAGVDVAPFDGIGLARTEFLFRGDAPPDEDTQLAAYCAIIDWAGGRPVTIRTLDAGGDKAVRGVTVHSETNPFLGLRGCRLYESHRDLFDTQLRALARAAATAPGRLKVMIPMVTRPAEMAAFRARFAAVVDDLKSSGVACALPALGMMVETPAAALEAASFDADFYSVGSNDLIQYTMAAARDDPRVARLLDPRASAVLKLIEMTVAAARARDVELSVCGDMASDPECVPLLLEAGVRAFSVAIASAAAVKHAVRQWSASVNQPKACAS